MKSVEPSQKVYVYILSNTFKLINIFLSYNIDIDFNFDEKFSEGQSYFYFDGKQEAFGEQ